MTAPTTERPLEINDEMLARFRQRAPEYDRENRFFQEDWDEIKKTGFLTALVPADLGGGGLTLAQYARQLQHIAEYAPATALAVNMHNYWVGIAAEMRRLGDPSLTWLLEEAMQGEVFAAGHAETGNDLAGFLSTTRAERVEGGYKFYGHKMFGSLTPVWTRLGIWGMDTNDPNGPQMIHAFMPRETPGYSIKDTWDTLGMRATKSDDTILDGCVVPDRYIGRILPAGQADLFILSLFAVALGGIAAVYLGIAHRALELAVATAHKRTSLALTRPMAYHPEVQHNVAMMATRLEAMDAQLDRMVDDWSNNVDHGGRWPLKIVSAKYNVVNGAIDIVDRAMAISGGAGMFKGSELERLYRDVRCGPFHPASTLLAPEIIGKIALGIDLGEQPRWG
ncbi:MAG TPA: acyl-CoA dehydrogenase family protein [Tepidiformaceae bacterium]|nr:acyl-CoA dehydrogenase family protein [Tepidiformaceae bacterium]